MKSSWLGLAVLLVLGGFPDRVLAGVCPAQLGEKIAAITERAEFRRSRWGILVQTPEGKTLYAQDADRYFVPASNAKLMTTAAALEVLGDRYTIRTSVYQVPSPDGVVLRVVGRGDPSFSDAQLNSLTQQIAARSIEQIHQLIIDGSYFQGDAVNPSWEWEDVQSGYGAPVNSLMLNENLMGLTLFPQAVGQPLRVVWDDPAEGNSWQVDNRSVTVAPTAEEFLAVGRDLGRSRLLVRGQLRAGAASEAVAVAVTQPDRHFLQKLRRSLRQQGITVQQARIATTPSPLAGEEIATITSATLPQLITEANQNSNNLYAESLLRTLGGKQSPEAESSLEAGLETLRSTLNRLGVQERSYNLMDGSGLSRRNWVTPTALIETLQGMARSPHARTYRDSLAIAGEKGTLKNRFRDTPVAGKLHGKTGFMSGVTALSGYLEASDDSPLVLSILVNQFDQPLGEIQGAIDQIVLLLAELERC
jgi:serine-type D-Ala-D-Ala carboxypeptidase/endopeptidase (penicillin-binding protein 4)